MFEGLTRKFSDIVRTLSGKASISEKNIRDTVEEIKIALLEADVNLRVVRRFINRTTEDALGEKVLRSIDPGQQFIKIIHDRMVELLSSEDQKLRLKGPDTASVILMLGLQGSGKTTSAAKLAWMLKKQGRKPLLVAADLVRPAAVEQLSVLGTENGIDVYTENSKDPVAVAKNGLKFGQKNLFNVIIIDTSGRLQADAPLMQELIRIRDAVKPDECLLVADAMTGQNAVEIAGVFHEKIAVTGVLLTKFDSDTRGGAALSIKSITGVPIKLTGIGEKIKDLEPFYPDRLASRILGMGDVVSLVEKAQELTNQEEAEVLKQKIDSETFTLADYLEQIQKFKKMGSIKSLLGMLPGLAGQVDESSLDEKELKSVEAIISSMTKEERRNYMILGTNRRKRIAKGSGTSVFEVNQLIRKFEKMRITMKKFSKNKKYQEQVLKQYSGNPK